MRRSQQPPAPQLAIALEVRPSRASSGVSLRWLWLALIVRPMSCAMKICTSKRDKLIALTLVPFKAFVVIAVPIYFLFRIFYPHSLETSVGNNTTIFDPVANRLLGAFALCAPVLLVGAVVQFLIADSRAGIRTLFFATIPALVFAFFLFLWVISHLL